MIGLCRFCPVYPMMERLTRRPPFVGYADFDQWNFVAFDLKSATDRWPLSVMHDLMACLFGPTLASRIVNGTLGLNTFHVCPPLLWCDEHNTGDILPGWSSTGILRLLDTVRAVSPLYYMVSSRNVLPFIYGSFYVICDSR